MYPIYVIFIRIVFLINLCNSKVYGACRHKTRFHRHKKDYTNSTDDGSNSEKGLDGTDEESTYIISMTP